MRAKHVAAGLESAAQLPEIVDFSVKDDGDVACFIEHGLVAAGKVDNTEAAHPKRGRGSDEQSIIIRATMPDGFHHPARDRFGLFGVLNSNDAADSTHGLFRVAQQNFPRPYKLVAQTHTDDAEFPETIPTQKQTHRQSKAQQENRNRQHGKRFALD